MTSEYHASLFRNRELMGELIGVSSFERTSQGEVMVALLRQRVILRSKLLCLRSSANK